MCRWLPATIALRPAAADVVLVAMVLPGIHGIPEVAPGAIAEGGDQPG